LRLIGDPEQPRLAGPELLTAKTGQHLRAGANRFGSELVEVGAFHAAFIDQSHAVF
jgi:hypothetical protein